MAESPAPASDYASRIRTELRDDVDRSRTPGLQYVAVDAQGVLAAWAVGWADLREHRAMTLETTMMAYSMTKTVTAIAILQLVERGFVDLDAPVSRYLAESPYGDAVTVREVLAHTGGLPNPIPLRWVHPASAHATFEEAPARAAVWRAHPRLARPHGSRFAYSNIGYWTLGAVLEQVTRGTFADYVTMHVLKPLGLDAQDAGFTIPAPDRHATGYLERWSWANLLGRWLLDARLLGEYDGPWRRIGNHYLNGPAFGGLVGTALAFARLLQDQLRPDSVLLGPLVRAQLYEQQKTADGTVVPMTLGWHVGDLEGTRVFYKEGGGGGFHCLMRLYPSLGLGSVLMTNATGFDVKGRLDRVDPLLPTWPSRSALQPAHASS